jgi:hypothetical protein
MGQVGWGFVVDQANTSTGSASGEVGIAAASGGIYSPTLQTAGMGGSGVTNTYNGPLNNLLIRPYLFANGEQGWWYDPSDVNLAWRRNLLTRTEEFDNAAWTKNDVTVTANTLVAPDGTLTADKLVESATTAVHYINVTGTLTGSTTYSISLYAKASERSRIQLAGAAGAWGSSATATFDLSAGTVVASSIWSSASITNVGNGWYRCVVTGTTQSVPSSAQYVQFVVIASGTTQSYAGDGTSGLFIWGAQLEVGSLTTYQQIVTPEITYVQDVQPLPILYQDAAGTTPVTAVEQPCSLMLDKRLGLTLGSELVTNGDFSQGTTGWSPNGNATISSSGNTLTVSNATAGTADCRAGTTAGFTTVVGRMYKVTGTYVSASGFTGNVSIAVGNTTTGSGVANQAVAVGQTASFIFTATATTTYAFVAFSPLPVGATFTVDNISVRELPGNHAFTPAAASTARPTVSARVNLLERTEDFANAYWSINQVTRTASVLTDNAATDFHAVFRNESLAAATYTYSIEAKKGTAQGVFIRVRDTIIGGTVHLTTNVDLSDGSIVGTLTGTVTVTSLPDGWFRIVLSGSVTAGTRAVVVGIIDGGATFYSGSGKTTEIRNADLRVTNDGVGLPPYQRVNTATDYDTVGFPVYLRADGSNDFLQTNSIDFSGTDKVTVAAGVRKLSDAAAGTVMELSTAIASNNGTFRLTAPNSAAANYAFSSKGTVASTNVFTSFAAPITNVITGLADISGDINRARLNAQSVGDLTSDQGTGNFGNFAMYLFSTAGTSSFFNGRFYGGVVRGAFSNDQQVQSLENYMNTKTAAFAPTTGSFAWNSATSTPATAVYQGYPVVTTIHQGMRRCLLLDNGTVNYYLDPLDSTKKADGTASVLTGADGQVMVEIPAFYTRRTVVGTVTTWEISQAPQTGYVIHPAFVKDGVQVPFRYYSAYDACVYDVSASAYISGQNYDNNSGANGVQVDVTATTGDVLASVSGVYPMVGLQRAEFRTIAANRGSGWRQLDWTLFSAVQLLYLIEHQSFFSQNILGNGNTATTYATTAADPTQAGNGGSEAGKSNGIGNASTNTTNGASSASRGVAWMSYRGIENFYGNEWNWTDGCIVNPDGTASAGQGDWWFTNNSADFSDSVRTNMTQIMSTAPTTSGFVSAIASVDNFFIATSVSGGSSSTYLTDQYFGSTSADRVVLVGGSASSGAGAGAFDVSADVASSFRARNFGARLAY